MAGLDSDETAASAMVLSVACLDSTPWSSSLIYLLRCPALISFSIRTLGFGTCRFHAHDLYDNCTARICFFGRDPSGSVQSI